MVRDVLQSKLGGEKILQEYATTKTLMDGTRRQMVNLLVADMIEQLTGEECREAISFMKHSADESVVKEKMKATFQCRQAMTRDQQASSTVLDVFPRFLDIPGLVDQDFTMMFGEEISGKMLARWPTFFKPRILADCKNLHSNVHVDDLLSAQQNSNESGKYFDGTVTCQAFYSWFIYSPQPQKAIRRVLKLARIKLSAMFSQAVCTDTSVTSQVTFDKQHVLNMCGSVVAQLQASGVAESTVQAMVGSMEEL
ncbi:hypothetical protein F7725_014530, partial [Dissostichus mawsoni]